MSNAPAKPVKADLHIHTCLSPCGDWDMSPLKIISKVKYEQIDVIAVCDHNTSKNAPPLIKLGKENGITVLSGMEICTKEEVHLLAIFSSAEKARKMEKIVYNRLIGENTPDIFGHQVIADQNDFVLGTEKKLLIGAADITLTSAVSKIHSLQGIAIAAHINRPSYSIISQLGFIPSDSDLDAVEISYTACDKRVDNIDYPCVCSSDAHFLKEIGLGYTLFQMERISFDGIKSALQQKQTHPCRKEP